MFYTGGLGGFLTHEHPVRFLQKHQCRCSADVGALLATKPEGLTGPDEVFPSSYETRNPMKAAQVPVRQSLKPHHNNAATSTGSLGCYSDCSTPLHFRKPALLVKYACLMLCFEGQDQSTISGCDVTLFKLFYVPILMTPPSTACCGLHFETPRPLEAGGVNRIALLF